MRRPCFTCVFLSPRRYLVRTRRTESIKLSFLFSDEADNLARGRRELGMEHLSFDLLLSHRTTVMVHLRVVIAM
jgi:hypothetical protein